MKKYIVYTVLFAITFTVQGFASFAHADEITQIDSWSEQPSNQSYTYQFLVKTKESQASAFLSVEKTTELWQRLASQDGRIKKVIADVYSKRDCNTNGTYLGDDNSGNDFCGELKPFSPSNTLLWSYGRLNSNEAAATYKTFLTFTQAGSSALTAMALAVSTEISVSTNALISENEEYEFLVEIKFKQLDIYSFDNPSIIEQSINLP